MSATSRVTPAHGAGCERAARRSLCAVALAALLAGCTHIVPNETAYYEDGPKQEQQSEGDLPALTHVSIVGWREDYLKVWADNGVIAYVWKGSVMPLPEWNRRERERKEAEEKRQRQEEAAAAAAATTQPVEDK